jgi:hypothetical protein
MPQRDKSLKNIGFRNISKAQSLTCCINDLRVVLQEGFRNLGPQNKLSCHLSFAYSALACWRMGMSGSPSFQSAKKSS